MKLRTPYTVEELWRTNKVTDEQKPHFQELLDQYADAHSFYYCTTKGSKRHTEVQYRDGDFLVFGKESRGLPENLLAAHYNDCIRIPMRPDFRSLNLSNAVAVVAFEAMRQFDFAGMEDVGHLTGRKEFLN